MKKIKVGVLSGYSSSKHAIAVLAGLHALPNVEVYFCANVKTMSYKRITSLIRRYGWRDALEKFKNVFISSDQNKFADETKYISEFNQQKSVAFKNIVEACNNLNVHFISVTSLSDEKLARLTKKSEIDLLIYSGGGILRKKLLDLPKIGVLNAHGGPLPYFRGMNGLEWSLLYNVKPEVSVHLIDQGIDTGAILAKFPIDIVQGDTISTLRGKSVVMEVKGILEVVNNLTHYLSIQQAQEFSEGKQFFMLHRHLKKILDKKLKMGWRPSLSCRDFEIKNRLK